MDGFSKFHFKGVGENEEIIKVLHRNWFYLLQQFFFLLLLFLVFLFSMDFIPVFFSGVFGTQSKEFMSFFDNFFFLIFWIYGFLIWIDYYFDIWIITTERIVNIEQRGMFARKVSEMEYSKMQDITAEVVGFFPTIINYGDVRVQTAAEDKEFVFRTISDPYHIKNIIFNMQKKDSLNDTEQLGEMIKKKIGA
ncbi:MAG: PH domain-containing protein [Candidatus Moranbacteria bacterium]|nr:PH domain-containing protein [Candidatus Moranbacteria bacterium]